MTTTNNKRGNAIIWGSGTEHRCLRWRVTEETLGASELKELGDPHQRPVVEDSGSKESFSVATHLDFYVIITICHDFYIMINKNHHELSPY